MWCVMYIRRAESAHSTPGIMRHRSSNWGRFVAAFYLLILSPPSSHALYASSTFTRRRGLALQQQLHDNGGLDNNKEDDLLLPYEPKNPFGTPAARSRSGVVWGNVHDHLLERLYPTDDLSQRNAASRTDGFWPYLQKGDDPPKAYTYGEFDFYSFCRLLQQEVADLMISTRQKQQQQHDDDDESKIEDDTMNEDCCFTNQTFTDIGSGAGRLVIAAAAMHPWRLCRGIEVLPGLHQMAQQTTMQWKNTLIRNSRRDEAPPEENQSSTPSTPPPPLLADQIEWTCGSFTDPYVYFGDSNVIFCFSTCLDPNTTIPELAQAIGRQCRPGTIVITTDYPLPQTGVIPPVEFDDRVPFGSFAITCVKEVDTWCWILGGPSKAYLHQVTKSLYSDNGLFPLSPPELSLQDRALQIVRILESTKQADADAFIRNVDNNVIFNGLPERFLTRPRN